LENTWSDESLNVPEVLPSFDIKDNGIALVELPCQIAVDGVKVKLMFPIAANYDSTCEYL